MHFSSGINRPPYEARDMFLQITSGCSHGSCEFCTFYKDARFKISPISEVEEDIKELADLAKYRPFDRIYLQGADPFIAPYEYLKEVLSNEYSNEINKMKLIGVTGTNGKTTSAYLLYQALNKLGIKTAYIGTIGFYMDGKVEDMPNTSVDICDTYDLIMRAYDKGYKTVIMEVSSHALANGRLKTIKFDYAVFTNLTQDHLDFHGTFDNYLAAKAKLFTIAK